MNKFHDINIKFLVVVTQPSIYQYVINILLYLLLEILFRLGQTKNKLRPTWRKEEKELNPAWRQKETGKDTAWRQNKN